MGFVKTETGEFCIAAHVLVPPAYLTGNLTLDRQGTSVVVYNEYFRPSLRSPRRNIAGWASGIRTLIGEGGALSTIKDGGKLECLVVFPATDGDLWGTTRDIEDFINIPARALMVPCENYQEFIETREAFRPQLYAASGNIRETSLYRSLLTNKLDDMEATLTFDSDAAHEQWLHIRKYFPVHKSIRSGMSRAFAQGDKEHVLVLAEQLRVLELG